MHKYLILFIFLCGVASVAQAQRTIEVPTRTGVTQRFLLLQPENPDSTKAAVILFAGGDGGVQLAADGTMRGMRGNFLVRTRDLFAAQGLAVAVIDAPSDRQIQPFLSGFRQTREHVEDVKQVIAWLRSELKVPVWLVGTSRGTQSAAYVTTQLAPDAGGPDGLVLTATMLMDKRGRPVPGMALDRIQIPVLVAHHVQDGCWACQFSDMPKLTNQLKHLKRTELITFDGGSNVGDPCEARGYHGFNGIEADVVGKIAAWILTP